MFRSMENCISFELQNNSISRIEMLYVNRLPALVCVIAPKVPEVTNIKEKKETRT
jgi:hypothetical protein